MTDDFITASEARKIAGSTQKDLGELLSLADREIRNYASIGSTSLAPDLSGNLNTVDQSTLKMFVSFLQEKGYVTELSTTTDRYSVSISWAGKDPQRLVAGP
ncbi:MULTISPECIES: hypothetical protein [unclassified Halomonas]|uniref:hypothetical protein n=1 Tax=unclassified Halomonas TaxID=2609666 RepID=UPI000552EE1C|nr:MULTISPECIES: hypothetical protein [unclassified Halomonas]CEP36330.1 Putative uncharacterized protein [Halomonas sp. R57-5]